MGNGLPFPFLFHIIIISILGLVCVLMYTVTMSEQFSGFGLSSCNRMYNLFFPVSRMFYLTRHVLYFLRPAWHYNAI